MTLERFLTSRRARKITFPYWHELEQELGKRNEKLKAHTDALDREFGRANSFQIAAADLFVEKAQVHLTRRANMYTLAGSTFAVLCLCCLGIVIRVIVLADFEKYASQWALIVVFALRGAALAGFAGAAVYFLASLSRAFFHEATALYNRRHALRFGRMFIYLKYGETKEELKHVSALLRA